MATYRARTRNAVTIEALVAQPTTRRVERSMSTAKYRQVLPATVRCDVRYVPDPGRFGTG